jgi:hypothetical protein
VEAGVFLQGSALFSGQARQKNPSTPIQPQFIFKYLINNNLRHEKR